MRSCSGLVCSSSGTPGYVIEHGVMNMQDRLPACLSARLSARLAVLSARPPARPPACLPACLHSCLFQGLHFVFLSWEWANEPLRLIHNFIRVGSGRMRSSVSQCIIVHHCFVSKPCFLAPSPKPSEASKGQKRNKVRNKSTNKQNYF